MSRAPVTARSVGTLALALGLLSVGTPARADSDTNSPGRLVTNAMDRFSVTLPAGWQPMPRELARVLADPVKAETRGFGAYGFELETNTNSLTPPFVTLQFVRSGRVADSYLRMMDNPELRRRVVLDMASRHGMAVSNVSHITFDTNEHRLSFTGVCDDEDGGQTRLWHHLIFTEQGSINMICVAAEGAAERWSVDFDRLQASLRLHSELAYQPRVIPTNVGSVTPYRPTRYFIIPGVVAVLAVARVFSNYFSERVMSDEI